VKDFSFYLFKQKQIPISNPYLQFTSQTTKTGYTIQNSTSLPSPYFSPSGPKIEEQRVLYHAGY
jgi:hypothetical protein